MFEVQSVNDTFVVGCKPYYFCFNSYVGEDIKKQNDFLQNQSHPPTVELAKEWKRLLKGTDGEGHESPCVCKLLDKVDIRHASSIWRQIFIDSFLCDQRCFETASHGGIWLDR